MLKLLIIRFHLTAVVKVIELLSEVVEDFSVASHVCRQNQDYHVPSHLVIIIIIRELGWNDCPAPVIYIYTSLNSSVLRLVKMLHSGEERILKETAQWWFSKGDMSLYLPFLNHASHLIVPGEEIGEKPSKIGVLF